jgi:hypothetical protein
MHVQFFVAVTPQNEMFPSGFVLFIYFSNTVMYINYMWRIYWLFLDLTNSTAPSSDTFKISE